jgi:hypothetical protein
MSSSTSLTSSRNRRIIAGAVAGTAILGGTALAATTAYAGSPATLTAARTSAASAPDSVKLRMHTSSPELDACFPDAWAKVKVDLTTDAIGKDTFHIKAAGLQPRTTFTVFLIEKAAAPFGAVEYIGDMTTNRHGKAKNTFELIAEEAFAFNNETGARTDLNSVGFWFGDPKDDDSCLGGASPVTGFDGDASAGVQMMNSGGHFLP